MAKLHKKLVLASSSPRRQNLIEAFNPKFAIVHPVSNESPREISETPEEYVLRLSRTKPQSVANDMPDSIILGADTTVVLKDQVLNKPEDHIEAKKMLESLRGKMHVVITGITVLDSKSNSYLSLSKSTSVTMREYDNSEISSYIEHGNPFDKAGSYAVQDTSFKPVKKIEGCYLNVVGLPICEIPPIMNELGATTYIKPNWTGLAQCCNCPLKSENGATK